MCSSALGVANSLYLFILAREEITVKKMSYPQLIFRKTISSLLAAADHIDNKCCQIFVGASEA